MHDVLELRNIHKSFPGVKALDDMSLTLHHGEIHAICGENGAGKSTLMKIITGVYQADAGEILLDGTPVRIKDPNDAFAKGIAIIYQETSLFPEMTVLDNIFMGHELMQRKLGFPLLNYGAMRQKAARVFERLEMEMDLDVPVKSLSVASQQMVEIAKALTYDANILIMDEPTAALTSREVDTLFRVVRTLKDSGVSILYISHRLEEIFQLTDRVTIMRDGQFVRCSDVSAITTDELISGMVGREINNIYNRTENQIGRKLLALKDVCQNQTLQNINMDIYAGEIIGLAGLVGSGRTELALAICGITQIDRGAIELDGHKIQNRSYADSLKRGIVYVSEDRKAKGLVIQMTVSENTTFSVLRRIAHGIFLDKKCEDETTDEYIQKLSIKTPSRDFLVENMSGGNQQKVSVSKALAATPKVLILDEPTRGVDIGAKVEIHKIINDLAREGMAIILISSDLPEVLGMSDRVYVMKDGSITGELPRETVTPEAVLSLAL